MTLLALHIGNRDHGRPAFTERREALHRIYSPWLGRDLGTAHRNDIARAALEAALWGRSGVSSRADGS